MPKIDLTISISVIVALCAIISPILTAIINNRYQLKLKKLELEQENIKNTVLYKRNIFENYLKYSGERIAYSDAEAQKNYSKYYFLALAYAPDEFRFDMIQVNQFMESHDYSNASIALEQLIPKICGMIQQL